MALGRSNRPLQQGLATVLVLAVVGYVGFLLYSQYQTLDLLNRSSLEQFVGQNDKRALAAGNFLADRLNDLSQLAENRDLALYYENKALGMTQEYGLGVSLAVAEETFRSFRIRKRLQEHELFSRLVYLDLNGTRILDLHGSARFDNQQFKWRSYLKPDQRKPHFLYEKSAQADLIVVSHPVFFKGRYIGQVLGWIPLALIYDHYLASSTKDSTFITALSMDNHYILVPPELEQVVPKAQLPEPDLIRNHTPQWIQISDKYQQQSELLATYSPLEQTPFALVTFYRGLGERNSKHPRMLLFAMGGVGVLLLGSGTFFLHTSIRNAALQVHLEESTLREQMMSEKNENLRKLTAAVEQSASAIVITDTEGTIEYVNPFFTRLTGYSLAEVVGQNPRILKANDDNPGLYEELWATITQGLIWSGVLHNRSKDGRVYWEQAIITPVKSDDGVITNYIAIKEDITEKKSAEEELLRAKEAAEAANLAKSSFLANMSHEIRTPMNGVIGMTDLCLDTELNSEQRSYLEAVKSSADNLLSIINDILDFSKIEAGKIELAPEPFHLRTTIGQALRTVAVRAVEKGLEIVFAPAADLPDALLGDPGRLRQILLNLVGNAVKFTKRGQIVVSARLLQESEGKLFLSFSIADHGIGISPEQQKKIFSPFEQADLSTTKLYGGTGLGLTISRRLVELMGGTLSVKSTLGVGSTFTFTAYFTATELPDYCTDDLQGKRVLVVDDLAINRTMLKRFLNQWGMEVLTTASAAEALEQLQRYPGCIDLALLDGQMPEENGWQLAATIRANHLNDGVSLVIMPSVGLRGDSHRCRELGISGYLVKPVIHAELYELLRVVLGLKPVDTALKPVTAHTVAEGRNRLRILTTDDVPVNQELIRAILEKRGHRVTQASNGQEAIDCWRSGNFDLLLMDVQMPEMDGLTATSIIRNEEKIRGGHVPIIAMTAYAMSGDRELCIQSGMDDYIAKPITPAELMTVIARFTTGECHQEQAKPVSTASVGRECTELVFDREALLSRLGGSHDLLPRFLGLFNDSALKCLVDLQQAIDAGDWSAARRHAHTIKGAAANVGAMQLRAAAQAFEKDGQEADTDGRKILLQEITSCYEHFLSESETGDSLSSCSENQPFSATK